MGLERRIERLEASTPPAPSYTAGLADAEHLMDEIAIANGELDPAEVPAAKLEESRRDAARAMAELEDEWRRMGVWP